MAFINEFKERFSKAAQSVSSKTKEGVEITRLSGEARAIESELTTLYEKIGRLFVESKGTDYDGIAAVVARVQELQERKEDIQAKKMQLKRQYACPMCGAVVQRGARFCSGCGRRMIEPEAAENPQVIRREVTPDSEETSGIDAE